MSALPLLLGTLAAMAIAYRFYSRFLAFTIARLDDSRATPAHRLNDGQNYDPTNRWVLFGHHFAAISGAGPLIGPVLAIQFGYMPGFIWLLVGVCLAGAVQDMLVLTCSVRNDGKSLAELARRSLGASSGSVASLAIFFIVIIALSGLGVVVVKALGGETVRMPAGTVIAAPENSTHTITAQGTSHFADIAPNSTVKYPSGSTLTRSSAFRVKLPAAPEALDASSLTLADGSQEIIKGSSWGTFTIACTIPIALFVGLYLYRIRKGRVMEASVIGAIGVLFATFAGNWIPGSFLEPWFLLSREGCILAICVYGFIASVLPVWLLLCPRDYISSILKLGTLLVLVVSVLVANPTLHAPAVNQVFAGGEGPLFSGAIFPFVFICIMCGAISGFHSLVSSGTTPKMINRESDIRMIGYGSMLLEGLVAIVALIAAASLPQGDYWAINIDLASVHLYADKLVQMGADVDHLPVLEEQVGGETLRGRTGGAVTLAVGMSQIMSTAISKFSNSIDIGGMMKYWYHFAIMFEALFILTTIDAGTRIARFLLQEILGKFIKPMERVDWLPGVIVGSAVVSVLWGGLIWTGSISTIWPMFGIANQLLAAIALIVVTTILFEGPNRKYIWVTLLPLIFVSITSIAAAVSMLQDKFIPAIKSGYERQEWANFTQGVMTSSATIFLLIAYTWMLVSAIKQWTKPNTAIKSDA
jgi:carbon starvation protein